MLAVLPGSTRATVVFFSNFGVAYTSRIIDVPASTGYGEPIQRLFKLKDGERIVAALSLDPRVGGRRSRRKKEGEPAAGARGRGDERRLQPALQPRAVRRAEHPRRAAATRGRPTAPRSSASRGRPATKSLIAATREARGDPVQGRRGELPVGPGQRRDPDQARVGRRPRARVHRVDRRPRL